MYGGLRAAIGARYVELDVDGHTVADARRAFAARFPEAAAAMDGVAVALDDRVVGDDADIRGARELSFLPPVSGG